MLLEISADLYIQSSNQCTCQCEVLTQSHCGKHMAPMSLISKLTSVMYDIVGFSVCCRGLHYWAMKDKECESVCLSSINQLAY